MKFSARNITGIGFDLDFTLYDQSQHSLSFFRAASGRLARETGKSPENVYRTFVSVWEARTPRYGHLFDEVLESLGQTGAGQVEKLVEEQRAWRPQLAPYPGIHSTLKSLRSRFQLFLVTDGHADTQRCKVDALGLAPLFDLLIYTGEFGGAWSKPNEAAFLYAANRLGLRPEQCIYAGDNPLVDGEGARRSGMGSIRVMRGPYRNVPARVIPDKEVRCASEIARLFGV